MTARLDTLAALKDALARIEPGVMASALPHFPLGLASLDEPLGGGLTLGAIHEIFAASPADGPAATGFALALAIRAAPATRMVWVRQRMVDVEFGRPHGPGLASLGLDPGRIVLVRADDAAAAIRAAQDAARAGAPGTVVAEIWGEPKILDLTASRRLSLAAGETGVTVLMVRIGAEPAPSAAASRWEVRAAPSRPLEAGAPGHAAFSITLLRHRAGLPTRQWLVEWDSDQCRFRDGSPLSRRLDAVPAGRKAAPVRAPAGTGEVVGFRRAG
jgi:protein ImuA